MSDSIGDLNAIVAMASFTDVFRTLEDADSAHGESIRTALTKSLAETHEGLRSASQPPDRLRYWLYREAVELKAQAAAFLNYEREMAQREAALWRFALERGDDFFRLVFDALDEYFEAKCNIIIAELEREATWYSNLRDHAKTASMPLAKSAALLKRGVELLKSRERLAAWAPPGAGTAAEVIADVAELDTRDVVTRLIETHLSMEILGSDVQTILTQAAERFQRAWEEALKAEAPDIRALNAFSTATLGTPHMSFSVDFGAAEYTFAAGMGGAIAGTLSLAAGWHVLAYAMAEVFFPAAIVAAVATVGVAVVSREKDLKRRRQKAREAIEQYHRHFVVQLDTGRLDQLGGNTLREAISGQVKELVIGTVRSWEKAISGNLTCQHYRLLGAACAAHLQLVQQCMERLPEDQHRGA